MQSSRFFKLCVAGLAGLIAVSAGAAESPPPSVDPLVARLFGPAVAHLDAAAAGREIKTSEFLAAYDRDQDGEREVMETFAEITEIAMSWVHADMGGRLAYCLPFGQTMPPSKLVQIVRDQVAKTPALGKDPYSQAILVSLQNAFPCPK